MKKIFSLLRLVIMLAALWLVARYWLGVNIPIFRKKTPTQELLDKRIQTPQGFSLSVFAEQLPGVRVILATETGDFLVSQSKKGKVLLLSGDNDFDGKSDGRTELLSGLNQPHGMDFYRDWLYIAETDAIGRIRFNPATGKTLGAYERIITGLPKGGNHWSRSIQFGPDGKLYVSIGSSCNKCEEKDSRRAAILRFTPEGSQQELFATGLRNTVGFDWHPVTGELYGVDNGSDFLGDDFPPDELNRIEFGKFYGWPYVNGNQIPDSDYKAIAKQKLNQSTPPIHTFDAHNAPLSIIFIKNAALRSAIDATALATLHGSWNRTEKSGYKIVALKFGSEQGITQKDFVTGFELHDDVIGRPVWVIESQDGSLYVTDDFTGSIYRLKFNEPK